jgi:hypothetical protein
LALKPAGDKAGAGPLAEYPDDLEKQRSAIVARALPSNNRIDHVKRACWKLAGGVHW